MTQQLDLEGTTGPLYLKITSRNVRILGPTTLNLHLKCHESYHPCHLYSGPLCFTAASSVGSTRVSVDEGIKTIRFCLLGNLTSTTDRTFSKTVVCKMEIASIDESNQTEDGSAIANSQSKDLENESINYCYVLRELQGSIIPEFYGFFSCPASDVRGNISCVLTQYHGKAIRHEPEHRNSLEVRYVIPSPALITSYSFHAQKIHMVRIGHDSRAGSDAPRHHKWRMGKKCCRGS